MYNIMINNKILNYGVFFQVWNIIELYLILKF